MSQQHRADDEWRRLLEGAAGSDSARNAALEGLATRTVWVVQAAGAELTYRTMTTATGRRTLPAFMDRAHLERAAATHGLRRPTEDLRVAQLTGRSAFAYVVAHDIEQLAVDPGLAQAFVVSRAEAEASIARPRRPAAPVVAAPQAAVPSAPRGVSIPDSLDAPRVLVVDDDPEILVMVQRFLKSRGCDVTTAGSPFGVTPVVLRQRPTVLVLDVSMPGLDGEQLWSLVRDAPGSPPAIVFYSALDEHELQTLLLRVPESEVVPKTAGLTALLDAVRRAHRRRVAQR